MTVRLHSVDKVFMAGGRSRRPLYRQILMMRSKIEIDRAKVVLQGIDLEICLLYTSDAADDASSV